MNRTITTKKVVESGILLAVGYVLSIIKLPISPFGGSVTLVSMLPLVFLGYRYGPVWGGVCGFVHSLLQVFLDGFYAPPTPTALSVFAVFVLDYALAWGLVGVIAGLIGKADKNPKIGLPLAAFFGIGGRYFSSYLSGALIFWKAYMPEGKNPWLWSFLQNGTYMLPEMVFTALVAFLLLQVPAIRKLILGNTVN